MILLVTTARVADGETKVLSWRRDKDFTPKTLEKNTSAGVTGNKLRIINLEEHTSRFLGRLVPTSAQVILLQLALSNAEMARCRRKGRVEVSRIHLQKNTRQTQRYVRPNIARLNERQAKNDEQA